jgi:hypothetical protein
MVNQTQALVLSFLLVAWLGLGRSWRWRRRSTIRACDCWPVEALFLAAIAAFITLLGIAGFFG